MFSRFVVVLDNLSEFTEPSVEWCKIRFVINCRLVHMVKYLLCNQIGSGEHSSLQPASRATRNRFSYDGRALKNQERERIDGLLQEIERCAMTNPHGRYLTVCRWCIFGLSDGKVEQRKQAEHICKRSVQPVIIRRLVISYVVQSRNYKIGRLRRPFFFFFFFQTDSPCLTTAW